MRIFVSGLALLALAGCASLSDDAQFSAVEQAVKERTGADTKWTRSDDDANTVRGRVKELLAKPLGPTEVVQIALLNNPGLQASYADVGIAEADLVQASRWRGPTFSFARLRRGDETETERGVFFDVLGLLTIPLFGLTGIYQTIFNPFGTITSYEDLSHLRESTTYGFALFLKHGFVFASMVLTLAVTFYFAPRLLAFAEDTRDSAVTPSRLPSLLSWLNVASCVALLMCVGVMVFQLH